MIKNIALLFCVASLALFGYLGVRFWRFQTMSPVQRLQILWAQDIQKMEASGKMPAAWHSIQEIELYGGTKESKEWLKQLKIPIPLHRDGTHRLEILLVAWDEGPKKGAMIQYDLVNIKTKNTEWELGRTFILRDKSSVLYKLVNARQ